MQKWSNNNDILMYSNYNKDQSLVDERFIRTLKGKIYIKKLLLKIAPVAMSIKSVIYNKSRYLIGLKSGITYVFFTIMHISKLIQMKIELQQKR